MLEYVPEWLGEMLKNVRAGHAKLVVAQPNLADSWSTIELVSTAFSNGGHLPSRLTADSLGVSPPLMWGDIPVGTTSLALIVEDPDAPTPNPLVHAILWDIPPTVRRLEEGAISADRDGGDGRDIGRNSYLGEGWLPPDPPTGHGPHDYVFQLFALKDAPDIGRNPGRSAFVEAIEGNVLGVGLLVGTYSRGEGIGTGISAARLATTQT
jgi:Raf kinase inhibitor-like YbhB/YbcL family protein